VIFDALAKEHPIKPSRYFSSIFLILTDRSLAVAVSILTFGRWQQLRCYRRPAPHWLLGLTEIPHPKSDVPSPALDGP
jgi:hypothetical protein